MSRRTLPALAAATVAVAAACAAGGGTSPVASVAPSAATACAETADPGTLAISIEDFEFMPATVSGRPGQVLTFTNTGFEHHNATVDGSGCATKTLGTGQHDGLVFTVAGSYPFRCTVHPWMTGTITIAE